jgi:hypothetical protein
MPPSTSQFGEVKISVGKKRIFGDRVEWVDKAGMVMTQ